MRIAVMSDVHGFDLALDTVLQDIDESGPFDQIIVAGDLCEVGPAPAKVLETMRSRDLVVVQGNTDFDIAHGLRPATEPGPIAYVMNEIGAEGIAYLAGLPFSHRISPPGGEPGNDDLLVVHANPQNERDPLDPRLTERELTEIIGDAPAAAIAFGHVHICYIRELGDRLLVDVSAVGNSKDGDLRCKYGVLTWDESARRWSAELRKLPYPLGETEQQIFASNLPNPGKVFRKLVRAAY